MGIKDTVNNAQEAVNAMPSGSEAANAARDLCTSSIEKCKGSGSFRTDLTNIGGALADLSVGTAVDSLKLCGQLATFQGREAGGTLAKILKDKCDSLTTMATAPLAVTGTTAQTGMNVAKTSYETAKGVAKTAVSLPVTAPLHVYEKVGSGIKSLEDFLFTSNSASDASSPPSAPTTSSDSTPAAA